MPKLSKESIIAELDARQLPWSEDMSYNELSERLKQAQDKEKAAQAKPPEKPIDYSNVRCGISTIQDHERRIVLLERELERLKNA